MVDVLLSLILQCQAQGCMIITTPDAVLTTVCSSEPIDHYEVELSRREFVGVKGLIINVDNCPTL